MNRNFAVGDSATLEKVITAEDVETFAKITGDANPVHLDEEYAKTTYFGRRIAHGMYISSLFSTLLGTVLPGRGTIYLEQNLKFTKPVFLGDRITAKVEIIAIREDKPIGTLRTTCTNEKNQTVVEGQAIVLLPR